MLYFFPPPPPNTFYIIMVRMMIVLIIKHLATYCYQSGANSSSQNTILFFAGKIIIAYKIRNILLDVNFFIINETPTEHVTHLPFKFFQNAFQNSVKMVVWICRKMVSYSWYRLDSVDSMHKCLCRQLKHSQRIIISTSSLPIITCCEFCKLKQIFFWGEIIFNTFIVSCFPKPWFHLKVLRQ